MGGFGSDGTPFCQLHWLFIMGLVYSEIIYYWQLGPFLRIKAPTFW